ncbi:Ankyrin Repeat Protein [Seminavis robusta]|uniref:Ankyrin Repeat Protein n=1 Tax=Seminavis robusta TaxID=568900 RepID=A0A9N8ELV6_9STRA|nr:Ankyrin Repeat Protein [Seminavis robusta]|eukprot:Sro1145_g246190.1 Ankyrin Repeat Protein (675) ;mRNA; r:12983-15007
MDQLVALLEGVLSSPGNLNLNLNELADVLNFTSTTTSTALGECTASVDSTCSTSTGSSSTGSTGNDLVDDVLTILKMALIQREREFQQQLEQEQGGSTMTMTMTYLAVAIVVMALCGAIWKIMLLEQQLHLVHQRMDLLTTQIQLMQMQLQHKNNSSSRQKQEQAQESSLSTNGGPPQAPQASQTKQNQTLLTEGSESDSDVPNQAEPQEHDQSDEGDSSISSDHTTSSDDSSTSDDSGWGTGTGTSTDQSDDIDPLSPIRDMKNNSIFITDTSMVPVDESLSPERQPPPVTDDIALPKVKFVDPPNSKQVTSNMPTNAPPPPSPSQPKDEKRHLSLEMLEIIQQYRKQAAASPKSGQKALHLVTQDGREDVMKALLDRGENANVKDTEGSTPLHLAAQIGNEAMVRMLCQYGADLRVRDRYGQTPLHGVNAVNVVETILDTSVLSKTNPNGMSDKELSSGASSMASAGGWTGHATGFDDDGPQQNGEGRIRITTPRQTKPLSALLLSAKDRWGLTPLHWAAINNKPDIVRILLDRGANTSITDKKGYTPLHRAALEGHFHVMEILVKRGANVSATDRSGATPLHYAASRKGNQKAIRLLLHAGADINLLDQKTGLAPLHHAAEKGHKDAVVVLLSDMNIDLNSLSQDGRTALLLAVDAGHKEVADLLRIGGAR